MSQDEGGRERERDELIQRTKKCEQLFLDEEKNVKAVCREIREKLGEGEKKAKVAGDRARGK